MSTMSEILAKYRAWDRPIDGIGNTPFALASKLEPPAAADTVEAAWPQASAPAVLRELWSITREAWLFLDVDYGQWGLHVLSANTAAEITRQQISLRPEEFRKSDCVLAQYMGEDEYLFLDADGRVLSSTPLDPRGWWFFVADNLLTFLIRYYESVGNKYWEAERLPYVYQHERDS